jgi:fatty acid kinase fatty acid binding subunit
VPRPTILVVDREESRRKEVARGLAGYGYEVITASGAAEGRRFAEGLKPGLIAVQAGLVEVADPFGLGAGSSSNGAAAPTVLLFGAQDADDPPEGVVALKGPEIPAADLLLRVRTALVAGEVGLQGDARLEALVGDLQRWPLFELLPRLQRAVVSGRVELGDGQLVLDEGEVVAARVSRHGGVKAFTRLARTAEGAFRIVLGPAPGERELFKDLLSLMALAIEDQNRFDEARAALPGLASRLRLVMGPVFFATRFSPGQQRVVEAAQTCRTVWHVLDKVHDPDGDVLSDLAQLHRLGIVALEDPEVEVRVVTDTAADLPPELADRLGIHQIPLSLIVGRELYRDRVDLSPAELYRLLGSRAGHRHRPRVEAPGREQIVAVYRALVARSDLVSIHASEHLTTTVADARAAVAKGGEEFVRIRGDGSPAIEVVDSAQISVGLGLLAVAAARMAQRRLHAGEIRARIEAMRPRVHTLFVADSLDLLAREGAVGRVRARLGAMVGIKPIVAVASGRITLVDQVRTGKTAQPRVVELLRQRVDAGRPVMVGVAHAAAPLWAVRLRNLIQDAFKVIDLFEGEIGPSVGTVLGVGCVGVALFQPTPEEEPLVSPVSDAWQGEGPGPRP